MSDMGWSRYIAAQEDAADMEMDADQAVVTFLRENGLRELLAQAAPAYLLATGHRLDDRYLAEAMWGVVESFCTRHAFQQFWHPTATGGLCSADETCPTCHCQPRPAAGHMCQSCSYVEPYAQQPSILDIEDLPF